MNTIVSANKNIKSFKRLAKSASPASSSISSSLSNLSVEQSNITASRPLSPDFENQTKVVDRYELKNVPQLEIKTDSKIELICSLASLLNIRNLEQNSRILLDLSQSKENCDLLVKSKNNLIIIKIIYDEWYELFEYFSAARQSIYTSLSFFIYENRKNLSELLNRRLNARRLAEQALNNLILNEYESNRNSSLKIDLLELVFKLVKFNESVFERLINQIRSNKTIEKSFLNDEKIEQVKFFLSDLYKQALIDVKHKLSLIELGLAQVLCELVELVWIFDETDVINSEKILEITLNCVKLVNILIDIKNSSSLIQNLINQLCSRRQWLNTIFRCLKKQLNSKPNHEFIKTVSHLIKNLTCRLNENLAMQSTRLDDNSLALLAFNEVKFTVVLTQYVVAYWSKIEPDDMKPILNSLLNLSILTFENKKSICHVNGSLELFISFLKSDNRILSRQIEEISISLLRTLSAYYSLNEKLRHKLRSLEFYYVLLNHSLTSSNLNIVANACNILWTMSSRSKSDQDLLISLGAETRLKALSCSSFDFISISCIATLKNIASDASSMDSSLSLSKSSSNSSDKSLSLTDSIMSTSSASSSFSFQSFSQPILTNRHSKQNLETSNEFQQKLNSFNFDKKIETSESSTSLSLTSISSSRSSSSEDTSSSSRSSSSESSSASSSAIYSVPKIKKNSYYLNENSIPDIVISKANGEPKKTKRVTFSGKEVLLFETHSSSSDSLCKTPDECNIEIFDNKLEDSSNSINNKNPIKQPFSPPINLKYIKWNSSLLNKSLFYNDDYNLDSSYTCNNNNNISNNSSRPNCLLATCEIDSNKENDSNLVLTTNQKIESNVSLSLLLEPTKDLISKIDANLTKSLNKHNDSKDTSASDNSKKDTIQNKRVYSNPPLPARSTSLQNRYSNRQPKKISKTGFCK